MDRSAHDPRNVADGPARRRAAAIAGHLGDDHTARESLTDPDPTVRAAALGAVARLGDPGVRDTVAAGLADSAPEVRRRACEVAAGLEAAGDSLGDEVLGLLDDPDPTVVEVAAWALGELEHTAAVDALCRVATNHEDALAREAAVAALGAIGDERGLAAILRATTDKPAVRRRAVLALAPFEGPEVDAALQRASEDRDWQVRDAADLLRRP